MLCHVVHDTCTTVVRLVWYTFLHCSISLQHFKQKHTSTDRINLWGKLARNQKVRMTVDQLTVKYGKLLQKNQYLSYTLIQLKGSVKELNMFHNYETEKKITCKARDTAENLQLYRVVRFFCTRSSCVTMHLMLFSERPPIYATCKTISGGRTKQHAIIGFGELTAVQLSLKCLLSDDYQVKGSVKEPDISIYFFFSPHHSVVFYFQCSAYWWKWSVRF